jgi:hypothetical protein
MAELAIVLMILVLVGVVYWLNRVWSALKWILTHVKVVSKTDAQDPEFTRIKQMFGLEDEAQGK